ncbi:hypothetical protein F4558_001040 [Micromonospora profundi]|nr:hypothetical protein [Micromonospora profundi]
MNTGRNGATINIAPPPRCRMPSAALQRDSPIQVPIRLRRRCSAYRRPARKLSDQPARQPVSTAAKVASPVAGRPTPTAARIATSPGTRTPTSGTASKTMTSPRAPISTPMGSSPT